MNVPHTIILPSGRISILLTQLFTFGLNVVSRSPVVLTRARLFLSVPFTHVNIPPKTIFPEPSIAIALTIPLVIVPVNVASISPVVVTRARPVKNTHCTPVKSPPTRIFPSD